MRKPSSIITTPSPRIHPRCSAGCSSRLQDDAIHAADESRPLLESADRTLQVHACHGPERQVEVLREVLVGLLADDPTLEPRDVLVMCPDIEDYAPLISATFGLADDDGDETRHPGHRLRVRLADRSLRQTNPLLAIVAALLELADARVTASQVLDLAASTPVRRRFRFDRRRPRAPPRTGWRRRESDGGWTASTARRSA